MTTKGKLDELAKKCHDRHIAFAIYFNGPSEWRIGTYSTCDSDCFTTGDWNSIDDAIDYALDFLFSINIREGINKQLEQWREHSLKNVDTNDITFSDPVCATYQSDSQSNTNDFSTLLPTDIQVLVNTTTDVKPSHEQDIE